MWLRTERGIYSRVSAWHRALAYFGACWVISLATGVLPELVRNRVVTDDQLQSWSWWAFFIACLAVIVIGYGIIWPIGTETHGRSLDLGAVILFGLLWGLSEAQLFLSFWSIIERIIDQRAVVAVLTFVVISAFTGLWHDKYWDRLVAPVHNIEEWNVRKVAFCHVPNLVITLTFLAVHENALLFVGFQTLALMLSTWFMRFPSPMPEVGA